MVFVKSPPTPEQAAALDQVRAAAEELGAAKRERDTAVLRASRAGASRRAVAEAAGISSARVQQIVDANRSNA